VISKFRERLQASKLIAQKLNVEKFSLKKLSEMGVRKQYQIKILKKNSIFGELK
jgi:Fe2+ transport system protein FeoA